MTGAQYSGGADGAALTRAEVTDITLSATEQGIYALDKVDEIMIICTPDFAGDWVAEAAQLAYAEDRQDAMVLLSPPEGASTTQAINYKRNVLASISNRGAMYHPWIVIEDPITNLRLELGGWGQGVDTFVQGDPGRRFAAVAALTGLEIYDVEGRLVRRLAGSELGIGDHEIVWDGRNEQGQPVVAGRYLSRIAVDGQTVPGHRITLVR